MQTQQLQNKNAVIVHTFCVQAISVKPSHLSECIPVIVTCQNVYMLNAFCHFGKVYTPVRTYQLNAFFHLHKISLLLISWAVWIIWKKRGRGEIKRDQIIYAITTLFMVAAPDRISITITTAHRISKHSLILSKLSPASSLHLKADRNSKAAWQNKSKNPLNVTRWDPASIGWPPGAYLGPRIIGPRLCAG